MIGKAKRDVSLTRGELASLAGCNIETIRYYEQIGLLPPPPRSHGGHRLYDQGLIKRLQFVRRSRELGFTLEEVRRLLRLVDHRNYTCEQVERLAREHIEEIARKIVDLKRLKAVLGDLASRCGGGAIPDCTIINTLFEAQWPLQGSRTPFRSRPMPRS